MIEAEKRRLAEEANKVIEAKEVIEDASHGGQVAHGERMEKGEDAAAATEKVEDGDKDTTIVLSDEEVEQFVTVKKREKQEEEKKKIFCTMRDSFGSSERVWNCKFCNRKYYYVRGRGSISNQLSVKGNTRPDQWQRYIECPGDWQPDTESKIK